MEFLFSTIEERKAFLELLTLIAKADGELQPEEIALLDQIGQDLQIDWKSLEEKSIENTLTVFASYSSKITVLQELIKLAFIDGDYTTTERQGVIQIAKVLDIDSNKVSDIEQWVHDGIIWIERGEELKVL